MYYWSAGKLLKLGLLMVKKISLIWIWTFEYFSYVFLQGKCLRVIIFKHRGDARQSVRSTFFNENGNFAVTLVALMYLRFHK